MHATRENRRPIPRPRVTVLLLAPLAVGAGFLTPVAFRHEHDRGDLSPGRTHTHSHTGSSAGGRHHHGDRAVPHHAGHAHHRRGPGDGHVRPARGGATPPTDAVARGRHPHTHVSILGFRWVIRGADLLFGDDAGTADRPRPHGGVRLCDLLQIKVPLPPPGPPAAGHPHDGRANVERRAETSRDRDRPPSPVPEVCRAAARPFASPASSPARPAPTPDPADDAA